MFITMFYCLTSSLLNCRHTQDAVNLYLSSFSDNSWAGGLSVMLCFIQSTMHRWFIQMAHTGIAHVIMIIMGRKNAMDSIKFTEGISQIRVSNRSAGMISSRFPGDIFTKIQQNLQLYRHLPDGVTNPWDHIDPVYPSNSSVKRHLTGIDSPNIN